MGVPRSGWTGRSAQLQPRPCPNAGPDPVTVHNAGLLRSPVAKATLPVIAPCKTAFLNSYVHRVQHRKRVFRN